MSKTESNNLPTTVNSLEELNRLTVLPLARLTQLLLKLGVEEHTTLDIILDLDNITKYYAYQYHELIVNNKLPVTDRLTHNPLGYDIHYETAHRDFEKLFNDKEK